MTIMASASASQLHSTPGFKVGEWFNLMRSRSLGSLRHKSATGTRVVSTPAKQSAKWFLKVPDRSGRLAFASDRVFRTGLRPRAHSSAPAGTSPPHESSFFGEVRANLELLGGSGSFTGPAAPLVSIPFHRFSLYFQWNVANLSSVSTSRTLEMRWARRSLRMVWCRHIKSVAMSM